MRKTAAPLRRIYDQMVDVYIPGCPPRPDALLEGITVCTNRSVPGRRDARHHRGASAADVGRAFIIASILQPPPWRKYRQRSAAASERKTMLSAVV